jgi:hypothetical protein
LAGNIGSVRDHISDGIGLGSADVSGRTNSGF